MSRSETALIYNDRSVLENHHISSAFRVMQRDDCNVLANLSREEYRLVLRSFLSASKDGPAGAVAAAAAQESLSPH